VQPATAEPNEPEVVTAYAGLRAELAMGYERIYTWCAPRSAWSAQ
jgi:hypothetical protein